MKMFFVLFAVVLLPISARALCPFGCTCFDDSNCQYYCDTTVNVCQPALPYRAKCTGYYSHPRECGTVYYCDPSSGYTCQLQKNYGQSCTYDWSCLSGYCDYKTNTCQTKNKNDGFWIMPILLPCAIAGAVLLSVFVAIAIRAQRRRAIACYQNPYIVLPAGAAYSYQNSYCVGETLPPSYPGAMPIPPPKTYQS